MKPPSTRSLRLRRTAWAGAFVALVLLLAGCTVYVVEGQPNVRARFTFSLALNDVLATFEPTRGPGASYRVGERIEFRIRARQTGYVTLTAIDPDGSVYTLARNIRVRSGETHILPSRDARIAFVADPPTGLHRVRASFTDERTDQSRVRYEGRSGEEGWTSAIRVELERADVRDVAETYLFVERR